VFPERARLAAMHDIYAHTIAKSDVRPLNTDPVDFEATIYRLPGVTVAMGATSGLAMRRTKAHGDRDDLLLSVCRAGSALGSEAGQEVRIDAGEAYLRTCGAGACVIQSGTAF